MNIINQKYTSIEQIRNQITEQKTPKENPSTAQNTSFDQILSDRSQQVQFSKHASERLVTRNIDMSDEQKARLEDATSQARQKGMKESLVMVDNLAFIVNVKSNMVVTAVNDTNHAVFTNIDGAIIN